MKLRNDEIEYYSSVLNKFFIDKTYSFLYNKRSDMDYWTLNGGPANINTFENVSMRNRIKEENSVGGYFYLIDIYPHYIKFYYIKSVYVEESIYVDVSNYETLSDEELFMQSTVTNFPCDDQEFIKKLLIISLQCRENHKTNKRNIS